jgi:hypothetical protein
MFTDVGAMSTGGDLYHFQFLIHHLEKYEKLGARTVDKLVSIHGPLGETR